MFVITQKSFERSMYGERILTELPVAAFTTQAGVDAYFVRVLRIGSPGQPPDMSDDARESFYVHEVEGA